MEHTMKLLASPFARVAAGTKTLEVRLFDEKRQRLQLGDTIRFVRLPDLDATVRVEVTALLRYPSFRELVNDFGAEYFGYPASYPAATIIEGCYAIYSRARRSSTTACSASGYDW